MEVLRNVSVSRREFIRIGFGMLGLGALASCFFPSAEDRKRKGLADYQADPVPNNLHFTTDLVSTPSPVSEETETRPDYQADPVPGN